MKRLIALALLAGLVQVTAHASADVFFKKLETAQGVLCTQSTKSFDDAVAELNKRLSDPVVIIHTDFAAHTETFVPRPFTLSAPSFMNELQQSRSLFNNELVSTMVWRACVSLNRQAQ